MRHKPRLKVVTSMDLMQCRGDEKWIIYDKNVRKDHGHKASKLHRLAKPGLTRYKLMLCVQWDLKFIIHYELLPPGKTIDSDLYCLQLMRFKEEVEKKCLESINRKSVVFTMITPDHSHL
ncbi:Mariner Mos1 transposase [Eumeta japonica]|uniref:Mariner Mos1 transposase n=1 Tax=Eumeta variegata TaxID=151549 RepID=A0A4C1YRT4_EUMVA|nr:Mariner Mos1 transposase [Eumeta japonica]